VTKQPQDDNTDVPPPACSMAGCPKLTPTEQLAVIRQDRQKDKAVDRDSWFNTKLLKIIGIIYGIATPFIVWIVVTSYEQRGRLDVFDAKLQNLDDKVIAINKVYDKLEQMNNTINKIQIDIATLKAKAGLP
jgi:hypothetical protein